MKVRDYEIIEERFEINGNILAVKITFFNSMFQKNQMNKF